MLKTELKKICNDLLLANNFEKVKSSYETIIEFVDKIDDENLKTTIKPIFKDDFQKIINLLNDNKDTNTMQERLQIFYLLTSLNLLIN